MKAVVIVSGGMDSVTLAHLMANRGYDLHLLSFNYGQRHGKELLFARVCAVKLHAQHDIIDLSGIRSLIAQSASSLVDLNAEVPEGHYTAESMKATVVPNRNAIMISIAAGVAVAEDATCIVTGVHAGDHAIYPDCRPQFIEDIGAAIRSGNEGFGNMLLHLDAPFLHFSKGAIATIGRRLHVDFTKTWSCYKGGDLHCGKCGTCVERHEALEVAFGEGNDPTVYES
jgi:7-cyano-7-deazaguanine synthase